MQRLPPNQLYERCLGVLSRPPTASPRSHSLSLTLLLQQLLKQHKNLLRDIEYVHRNAEQRAEQLTLKERTMSKQHQTITERTAATEQIRIELRKKQIECSELQNRLKASDDQHKAKQHNWNRKTDLMHQQISMLREALKNTLPHQSTASKSHKAKVVNKENKMRAEFKQNKTSKKMSDSQKLSCRKLTIDV